MSTLKTYTTALILVLLSAVTLSAQKLEGNQEDLNIILKNIELFSSYFMAGEAEKMAQCYTVDGKIFPSGQNIIEGTSGLNQYWTLSEGTTIVKHKIIPREIKIIEDYAYDYGYYEGATKNASGQVSTWQGKYVIVWKKVDDQWKIYLDIWNPLQGPIPTN